MMDTKPPWESPEAGRPAPEPGPVVPPAGTLAEARAACVGRGYVLFEDSFDLFDAAGGFRPTFVWPPLLFGVFWFVYRRMYAEAAAIFLGQLGLMFILEAMGPDAQSPVMPLGLGLSLALALTGRWFYWRAVDRRIEKAMSLYPRNPAGALRWLKMRGGGDPLTTALAVGGLTFLVLVTGA